MRDFIQGFMKGVRETPRGFFAPAVMLCRLFIRTYDTALQVKRDQAD